MKKKGPLSRALLFVRSSSLGGRAPWSAQRCSRLSLIYFQLTFIVDGRVCGAYGIVLLDSSLSGMVRLFSFVV